MPNPNPGKDHGSIQEKSGSTLGWALEMDVQDAVSLAPLRLRNEVEVALSVDEMRIWVRGSKVEEAVLKIISLLPAVARYEWIVPDRLRKVRSRIPAVRLPELSWQPLSKYLIPQLPELRGAGQLTEGVELSLVRTGHEAVSSLLWSDLTAWSEFAIDAPRIRLLGLQYAVSSEGKVLIRGQPLPPIAGTFWVEHSGIAVPSGYHWEPAVLPEVLEARFRKPQGGVLLWFPDQTLVRIHADQFVEATRSSILRSAAALSGGSGDVPYSAEVMP